MGRYIGQLPVLDGEGRKVNSLGKALGSFALGTYITYDFMVLPTDLQL